MPPNHFVRRLLTGKKRKAPTGIGASSNSSVSNHEENEEHPNGGAEDNRGRKIPTPNPSPQFGFRESHRALPMNGRMCVTTATATATATEQLRQLPKEQTQRSLHIPRKQLVRHRCRQRYLRCKNRSGHHSNIGNDGGITSFERLEGFRSSRKRKRRQAGLSQLGLTKNAESPPAISNDDSASLAESTVRSFLEQRRGNRVSLSPLTTPTSATATTATTAATTNSTANGLLSLVSPESSSSSSPLEDPAVLPVVLLGLAALGRLAEWHDRKREEEALLRSSTVRELIVWMKARENSHIRRQRDALRELEKFHKAVDESHQTSLELLSQQRFEEEDEETKEGHEHPPKRKRQQPSRRFGHLGERNAATESGPTVNQDLIASKTNRIPQTMPESAAVENPPSSTSNDPDSIRDKPFRNPTLPNHSTTQMATSAEGALSSSSSSRNNDQRTSFDSHNNRELMLPPERLTTKEQSSKKTASHAELQEGRERPCPATEHDDNTIRVKVERGITNPDTKPPKRSGDANIDSNMPAAVEAHKDTPGSSLSSDKVPAIALSNDAFKETSEVKPLGDVRKTDANGASMSREEETDPSGKMPPTNDRGTTGHISPTPSAFLEKHPSFGDTLHVWHHDHENDETGSVDSFLSEERSQILLSQSQKGPLNPRRVTASPGVLLANTDARREPGDGIDCSGRTPYQSVIPRCDADSASSYAKAKARKWKNNHRKSLRQSSLFSASSQSSWMSKAPRRAPSLKQTSLKVSAGWVSNQKARDFVNTKPPSSPMMPAKAVSKNTDSTAPESASRGGNRATVFQKENVLVPKQEDDEKTRIPLCDDGFVKPASRNRPNNAFSSNDVPREESPSNFNRKSGRKSVSPDEKLQGAESEFSNTVAREETDEDDDDDDDKKRDSRTNTAITTASAASPQTPNPKDEDDFRCIEVIRGRKAREGLKFFKCSECDSFINETVLRHDTGNFYNREELMRCSRHRARHSPPQTPEDFWELSFIDEKRAREQQEVEEGIES